jgi:hypothetical protein
MWLSHVCPAFIPIEVARKIRKYPWKSVKISGELFLGEVNDQ